MVITCHLLLQKQLHGAEEARVLSQQLEQQEEQLKQHQQQLQEQEANLNSRKLQLEVHSC